MGNRDAVVIELDSAPPSLDVPTSGDYLERCVVSALFRPALRLCRRAAGRTISSSSSRMVNASPTARRCSRGMCCKRSSRRVIVAVGSADRIPREGSRSSDDRLCLSMRRPACFFPDMLRTVDFAPTHPDGLGNGPYRIGDEFDADRGYYHLTPNPHVEDSDERPELVFRLQTDVDGAPERFLRGESDITCNTAFPLDRLRRMAGKQCPAPGTHRDLHAGGAQPVRRRAAGGSVPAEGDARDVSTSPRSLRVFPAACGPLRSTWSRARPAVGHSAAAAHQLSRLLSESISSGEAQPAVARSVGNGHRTRRARLCGLAERMTRMVFRSAVPSVQPSVCLLRPVRHADGGHGASTGCCSGSPPETRKREQP